MMYKKPTVKKNRSDFHACHFFLDLRDTDSDTAHMTPVDSRSTWKTLKATAEILDCSLNHVKRLVKEGRLQPVNISWKRGGRPSWRIPPEEIERFRKEEG